MVTEEDVIKAIVQCKKEDNSSDYFDVCNELNIDDLMLINFIKSLNAKGYIHSDLEKIYVTSTTMSVYNKILKKQKPLLFNFTKFTLKIFYEIIIGIIITVLAAFIIYHFGWQ